MYGEYGPLVGNVQSVLRAELSAVVQAIRYFAKRRREIILEGRAPPTHVHIVSDCMSVVVAHGKGAQGHSNEPSARAQTTYIKSPWKHRNPSFLITQLWRLSCIIWRLDSSVSDPQKSVCLNMRLSCLQHLSVLGFGGLWF